jgi:hypothetical protein
MGRLQPAAHDDQVADGSAEEHGGDEVECALVPFAMTTPWRAVCTVTAGSGRRCDAQGRRQAATEMQRSGGQRLADRQPRCLPSLESADDIGSAM